MSRGLPIVLPAAVEVRIKVVAIPLRMETLRMKLAPKVCGLVSEERLRSPHGAGPIEI